MAISPWLQAALKEREEERKQVEQARNERAVEIARQSSPNRGAVTQPTTGSWMMAAIQERKVEEEQKKAAKYQQALAAGKNYLDTARNATQRTANGANASEIQNSINTLKEARQKYIDYGNKYGTTANHRKTVAEIDEKLNKLTQEYNAATTGTSYIDDLNRQLAEAQEKERRAANAYGQFMSEARSHSMIMPEATRNQLKTLQEAAHQAREEREAVEKELEQIEYLNKYSTKQYAETGDKWDDFWEQSKANYNLGRIGQDKSKAFAEYSDNPTEENQTYAMALKMLEEDYAQRNAEVLDDEGAVLSWVSQNAASYAPQAIDQGKGLLVGGGIGALAGSAVGMPLVGAKIGASIGSGVPMYDVVRGAAIESMVDAGIDITTATRASQDEAILSALIEMAETGVDFATFGATGWMRFLGNYGMNIGSEGLEEALQQGVSIANRRRAESGAYIRGDGLVNRALSTLDLAGDTLGVYANALLGRDDEARGEMWEAAKEGGKTAAVVGGVNRVGGVVAQNAVNRANNRIIESDPRNQYIAETQETAPAPASKTAMTSAAEQAVGNAVLETAQEDTEAVMTELARETVAREQGVATEAAESHSDGLSTTGVNLVEGETKAAQGQPMNSQQGNTRNVSPAQKTESFLRNTLKYSDNGVKFMTKALADTGASFQQVFKEVDVAYRAGDLNVPRKSVDLRSALQQQAYDAGRLDFEARQEAQANRNMVIHKNGGLFENDATKAMPTQTQSLLNKLGKATGTMVIMDESLRDDANGSYVSSDGAIHMSPSVQNPVGEFLRHEFTHRTQDLAQAEYNDFRTYVYSKMCNKGAIYEAVERYAQHDVELADTEAAMDEVVAEFSELILTDEKAMSDFINEISADPKTRSWRQKVIDIVHDIISKVKSVFEKASADEITAMKQYGLTLQQVRKAEQMWRDAAKASVKNAQAEMKKQATQKENADVKQAKEALGEGAKIKTNADGELLTAQSKDGSKVIYSVKTYKDGGRTALRAALKLNGHTEAEINDTLALVDDAADYLTILAAGYARSHNYTALSDHLLANITTNVKTGKQVMSALVNNGDYPVNIDLALICKKRVAYMNLMNRLIKDGIFDKVNYQGEAIADVNDILRLNNFETACLGCFVESRRLQFQSWAETIVSEWNEEVDKRKKNASAFGFAEGKPKLTDADMDALTQELKDAGKKNKQGNLNLGQGAVQTKMGRLLDKVPSLQQHLTVADLLTPDGLAMLRSYDSNLFSLVKSRYGAASPKIVQDFNPYASELAMMTFKSVSDITSNAVKGAQNYIKRTKSKMGGVPKKMQGETQTAYKARKAEFNKQVENEAMRQYLYDIGGARIQSFSDFMVENVFDYLQIFADLAANRFPLHGYTKEIICMRLFGMTGAKWNGSLIAHTERSMGKEYAGLLPASAAKDGSAILVKTDEGEFAIGFDDYARNKATGGKSFIQSIGMKDIVALQLDPRYASNVGSITIGVSDKQILAMLDSPLFSMVIPYHASGMIPQFAQRVGVDMYNDYTNYQNTTVAEWFDAYGNPTEPIRNAKDEVIKVDTSYPFNAEIQKTGDAKKAADSYLKWCSQKHPVYDGKNLVGYATFNPKFSDSPYGTDFTKHPNYYKLLEDFSTYDCITGESAVQGAVTMTFPSEENRLSAKEMEAYKQRLRDTGIFTEKDIAKYEAIANKTFKELIADEVKGRAEYKAAQDAVWEKTVKQIEDKLMKDHPRSGDKAQTENSGVKYSLVTDRKTLDFLNNQKLVKVYRAMQLKDGKLYPPMAALMKDETGKKKLVEHTERGAWYQADERPDLIKTDKNGRPKFELNKGNGGMVPAAYNPYFHTSASPLNDQFSSAYDRPNLVVVEGYIPSSELTSGYKAQYAKDSVGETSWHAGPVASKLKGAKARRVFLSRWFKAERVVPDSEVAKLVAKTLEGEDVTVPWNVVTPSLRKALEAEGVEISYGDYKAGSKIVTFESTQKGGARYSLKASNGYSLSEAQAEYFKDSKVRDENGNLLVMFHGTSNGTFTAFDTYGGKFGLFGMGSYFTDNPQVALSYTEKGKGKTPRIYSVFLNIKNPLDMDAPADVDKWRKAFKNADLDPSYLNDIETNEDAFKALKENLMDDYYERYEAEELVTEMILGMGYDGITHIGGGRFNKKDDTRHRVYIAFEPEQIKDTGNENPTTEADIHLSLKNSSEVRKAIIEARQEGKKQGLTKKQIEANIHSIVDNAYADFNKAYGTIDAGENPTRTVNVPKKTGKHEYVSESVRTALEAGATPDEMLPTINQMVAEGEFSYARYSDKDAMDEAEKTIKHKGDDIAFADWMADVTKNNVTKDNVAMGWTLYNAAANAGDTKKAITILTKMVGCVRNAAQALQATRILKKLSPSAQLYGVQRSVEHLQEELIKKYGDKAPDLQINEELAKKFLEAKTEKERNEAMKELYADIGRQMPASWLDKWNAWRYLAMLGNPRTHVRNILGNALFAPVVAAKNVTAMGIENLCYAASLGKMQKNKGIVTPALLKAAWNDYANVADIIDAGGKYNDAVMQNQAIQDGRRIFKFKPLEWARKGNSYLLGVEDRWFAQPHYANALAQYCKTHHITAEQIARGKAIDNARAYAMKEAMKATYKDTNAFSEAVSQLGKYSGDNPFMKALSIAAEGVLPFRKTPANILARGVEYSPIGILKAVYDGAVNIRKGKMTAADVIDELSAGLTGTGLMLLGAWAAAQGLVRGSGGDDEEEKKFKELQGHQNYALVLGDKSYTIDWLAPEALPFLVGVNYTETAIASEDGMKMSDIISAVTNITEPLLELSCLQSLNDLLDSVGYASSNDASSLVSIAASAVTSYLTQAVPTLFGQIERTYEEERMTTYTSKDDFLTPDMQYAVGKVSAKIPNWDYGQIPYIDAWGRTEESGLIEDRALANFIKPWYESTITESRMEKELERLYNVEGDAGVFPDRAEKKLTVDGETVYLTAEQYVRYATAKGQMAQKMLTKLTSDAEYKKLSNADKLARVKRVYEYTNAVAKMKVSNYEPDGWVAKAVAAVDSTGIDDYKYLQVYEQYKIATAEEKRLRVDGVTIPNSKGLQTLEVLYAADLTDKQRKHLMEDFGVGKTVKKYSPAKVKEELAKMRRKADK